MDLIIYIPVPQPPEVTPPGRTLVLEALGAGKGKSPPFPGGDVPKVKGPVGTCQRTQICWIWCYGNDSQADGKVPVQQQSPSAQVFAPQDMGAGCTAQTLPQDSPPQSGEGQGSHHHSPCPFGCRLVTLARKNLFLGLIKILLKHIFSSSKHTRFQ